MEEYTVIEDVSYYGGDCQHPSGWELTVATVNNEGNEEDCIGTLEECREWLDILNDKHTYLSHGQAGKSYRIASIEDEDADYNSWLDGVDWDGWPSEDGSDYDANTSWAEDKAYRHDGILPIADNQGRLILINISPDLEVTP